MQVDPVLALQSTQVFVADLKTNELQIVSDEFKHVELVKSASTQLKHFDLLEEN